MVHIRRMFVSTTRSSNSTIKLNENDKIYYFNTRNISVNKDLSHLCTIA